MDTPLRVLLSEILDYAGLFPPAQLPLDQAIRNYARYSESDDAWMLGRFICPAGRLAALAAHVQALFSDSAPLRLSILGRGGDDSRSFRAGLTADLDELRAFRAAAGTRASIEAFETRWPVRETRGRDAAALFGLLQETHQALAADGLEALPVAWETPPGLDLTRVTPAALAALAIAGATPPTGARPGALKLRCGGTEAAAFPTCESVGFVLAACRDHGVPLKFTAGLHHPVRHFAPEVQTRMHGFLNVFFAAMLAFRRALDETGLVAILADDDPASFSVSPRGLAWRDQLLPVDELADGRRWATSFGSCSFDEPRADLRALGWLP